VNWHNRYLQQAAWTRELRIYLFKKAGLSGARAVLEVGCGTGAILRECSLPDADCSTSAALHGVDLSAAALTECRIQARGTMLTCGDALYLPYLDKTFDITYCHFLLLWVKDPLRALIEMKRVTRSQGFVLALAEPDYTARVDQPREIAWLGKQQTESLKRRGADVGLGSRLADLFYQAGIPILETGVIKSLDNKMLTFEEWENEWEVLETDLEGIVQKLEIQQMKHVDEQAWRRGEHIFNVPTYFSWGQV
jgi:ubiquinone/menaquinone biosynthesis C-methylase UbiE